MLGQKTLFLLDVVAGRRQVVNHSGNAGQLPQHALRNPFQQVKGQPGAGGRGAPRLQGPQNDGVVPGHVRALAEHGIILPELAFKPAFRNFLFQTGIRRPKHLKAFRRDLAEDAGSQTAGREGLPQAQRAGQGKSLRQSADFIFEKILQGLQE